MGIFSFKKIKHKLTKSSSKISEGLNHIFTKKKIDEEVLEELEELLITCDMGIKTASGIVDELRQQKFNKEISIDDLKEVLSGIIYEKIRKSEQTLEINDKLKPQVILFTGVNGSGKTTTIGKIAKNLKEQNKKVLMGACDTFRAAAVDQLGVWADRIGCDIVEPNQEGEDPASVAYRSIEKAQDENYDVLLLDTAGRLHNKKNLMEELKKVTKVLNKKDISAPHNTILVLDATTGQNARNQFTTFKEFIDISGVIMTKLDGTAKGGILVSIADEFKIPIHAVGVGEKEDDLREFNAKDFVDGVVGIE